MKCCVLSVSIKLNHNLSIRIIINITTIGSSVSVYIRIINITTIGSSVSVYIRIIIIIAIGSSVSVEIRIIIITSSHNLLNPQSNIFSATYIFKNKYRYDSLHNTMFLYNCIFRNTDKQSRLTKYCQVKYHHLEAVLKGYGESKIHPHNKIYKDA